MMVTIAFKDAKGIEIVAVDALCDTYVRIPPASTAAIFGGWIGAGLESMFLDNTLVMLAQANAQGAVTSFIGTYADAIAVGWAPPPAGGVSAKGALTAHASVLRADGTYEP